MSKRIVPDLAWFIEAYGEEGSPTKTAARRQLRTLLALVRVVRVVVRAYDKKKNPDLPEYPTTTAVRRALARLSPRPAKPRRKRV